MRHFRVTAAMLAATMLAAPVSAHAAPAAKAAPAKTPTPSVISLGSTGQVLFVVLIVAGLALLWFGVVVYDRISANRRLKRSLETLIGYANPKNGPPLSVAEVTALAATIRESPAGAKGLARSVLALGLLSLVGIALTGLLVGNAAAVGDLLKTTVTAITAALTTVVGFYFGASTASDAATSKKASTAAKASGKPGAPTDVTATAGTAEASVAFKAPADDGGSAIIEYTVTSSPPGFTESGTKSPIVVKMPHFDADAEYTFTVTARNKAGSGPASGRSNAIKPTVPPA